jgi:hypothetical protein
MLKLISRFFALSLMLSLTLFVAGCGGGGDDATLAGTYNGNLTYTSGGSTIAGPASVTISSTNVVSGTWTATQGSTTSLVVFTGTVTAGGAFTASGFYSGTEIIRLTGIATASSGVLSGTYLTAGGGTGVFSFAK